MAASTVGSVRKVLGPVKARLIDVTEKIRTWVENADNDRIDRKAGIDLRGKLNKYLDKFNEIVAKLELTSKSVEEIAKFEEDIEGLTTIMLDAEEVKVLLDNRLSDSQVVVENNRPERSGDVSAKLPKVILPTFSGIRLKWFEFWERFETAVHNRTNISKVDKFNYLKQQLSGDAAQAIAGLLLTSENYDAAIEILKSRFSNKGLIIENIHYKFRQLTPSNNHTFRLRSTLDHIENFCRSLEGLGEDIENSNTVSLIRSKFPSEILLQLEELRMYEGARSSQESTTVYQDNDTKKIRKQLDMLISNRERVGALGRPDGFQSKFERSSYKKSDSTNEGNSKVPSTTSMLFAGQLSCRYCSQSHWTDECPKYSTLEARKKELQGCCFKCLKKTRHTAKNCGVKKLCYHCKSKLHHRSLCPKKLLGLKEDSQENNNQIRNNKENGEVQLMAGVPLVAMQTATVEVCNDENLKGVYCRAILDSGSHRSYITEALVKNLRLVPIQEERLTISVFGTTKPRSIESYTVEFKVKITGGLFMSILANVVPFIIKNKIEFNKNLEYAKKQFPNLNFADKPKLLKDNSEIQILIGNNYYFDIINLEKIEIQRGLHIVSSKFGWIISGRSEERDNSPTFISLLACSKENNDNDMYMEEDKQSILNENEVNLKQFWSLETIGIKESGREEIEDDWALEQFKKNIKVTNGRYSVSWPWRQYPPTNLADNYRLAIGRLRSLYKRIRGDKEIISKYNEIITQQLSVGVIEKVEGSKEDKEKLIHYLPHHAVFTPQKTSTKVRVVYDGSAVSGKGKVNLNQSLLRGQDLLEELVGILLRFRLKPCILVGDIEKAFLQIGLNDDSRDVTRFIWLKDPFKEPTEDNLEIYRFCRVLFGVISSPFMLNVVVRYHVLRSKSKYSHQICRNMYVDNLIAGFSTDDEALDFYKETKGLFNEASMNVREWNSNSKNILIKIPETFQDKQDIISVLGIVWNTITDHISIKMKNKELLASTKRQMLKVVSSIFDPLGLCSPVSLRGKLFMKTLWENKSSWDEFVGEELQMEWNQVHKDLREITTLKLDRHLNLSGEKFELHCFCDASKVAYAAVIYLKSLENKRSKLIFAKSRVAPKKEITIPRLELLGVTIGCRCLKLVEKELEINIVNRIIWSDSKCVISWINKRKPLPIFVEHRVAEIKEYKGLTLRFVPGHENIADIASRGCNVSELSGMKTWWEGPAWLEKEEIWPEQIEDEDKEVDQEDTVKEMYQQISLVSVGNNIRTPYEVDEEKFSELFKILRVTAWVHRVIMKFKRKLYLMRKINFTEQVNTEKYLNEQELKLALTKWETYAQDQYYGEIKKDLLLERSNLLINQLGLYLDDDNIIRCKGRFKYADLEQEEKCPILLPGKGYITKLVIKQVHKTLYHVGVSHTLSELRRKYWVPKGRSIVTKVLRKCIPCNKLEGKPFNYPKCPALPEFRVTKAASFSAVGIDYLGPLWVNYAGEKVKIWICLFTCLVVRAIHLEVVSSLSAEDFLLCLRRFIARRGVPSVILSDNAMQFRTVDAVFRKKIVRTEKVNVFFSEKGIVWRWVPEFSPWMGGAYERLIGLTKRCLKKTIGHLLLTREQLDTITVEVEAVLNSRPLVYVGTEAEEVLTPSHLTQLRATESFQVENYQEERTFYKTQSELLLMWKKGVNLLNQFWEVWKKDYLLSLRERATKTAKRKGLRYIPQVGEVVLIEDKLPRQKWKLGRIESVNVSRDGAIRSVVVKTSTANITRPVSKIYPLEVEE